MSSKVLLRILLLLAVAVLLWGGLAVLNRSSTDRPVGFALPAVSVDSATMIAYIGPQDTVQVVRQGNAWTVNGHAAAQSVVQRFFQSLSDTGLRSELVAQSAESHARLGVDSASGRHLTVQGNGKTWLDLWLGNRGPDFEGFYARKAGDAQVFLLHGSFADLSVQPMEEWREKQVLWLQPDAIGRVEVQRGRQGYSLTRSGKIWSFAKGGAADSVKVTRWLGAFRELRATSFPSPAQVDSARFAPPERVVKLFGVTGDLLGSVALDSIASTFVMRVNDKPDLYTLEPRMANLVAPADTTFRK